jgi:TRAP-type C4-dicarboxylate transport system substrate-binding protein
MTIKTGKKPKAVIAVMMALMLILAACGGSDSNDTTSDQGGGDASEAEEQLEPVIIRWQSDTNPPPHPNAVTMEWFKDQVEEQIPGSEVRIFYAGSLYSSNPDALEAAALGNVELVNGQYGKDSPFEPTAGIVNLPAALTTPGAVANIYDTETMRTLRERMAALGVTTLANASLSFFIGYGGKCPHPSTPEDLRGMNIRAMDTVIGPAVLGAWGANPIAMAFSDVPSALETGVLDGALTSVGGWGAIREQTPCYTAFGIGALGQDPYAYHASTLWLDSLNAPTRAKVEELVREAAKMSMQFTWCEDMKQYDSIGTTDVNSPGFLIHPPEVVELFTGEAILGDSAVQAVQAAVDESAQPLVAAWFEEARALNEAHPLGTSDIENADCAPFNEMSEFYTARTS